MLNAFSGFVAFCLFSNGKLVRVGEDDVLVFYLCLQSTDSVDLTRWLVRDSKARQDPSSSVTISRD